MRERIPGERQSTYRARLKQEADSFEERLRGSFKPSTQANRQLRRSKGYRKFLADKKAGEDSKATQK